MAKVCFLGFGFDANSSGGGVTLFGVRMGGGPNGFEAGLNVGLGASVGEQGLYAGAKAGVTVGGSGVGAQSGASATAGDAHVQAAAMARSDGNTMASVCRQSEVDSAARHLQGVRTDCVRYKNDLKKVGSQLAKVALDLSAQHEKVKRVEAKLTLAQNRKKKAGVQKTEVKQLQASLESERRLENLASVDVELLELMDVTNEEMSLAVRNQECRVQIIVKLNNQIDELTKKADLLHSELMQAAEDVVQESKILEELKQKYKRLEAEQASLQSVADTTEKYFHDSEIKLKEAKRLHEIKTDLKGQVYHMS